MLLAVSLLGAGAGGGGRVGGNGEQGRVRACATQWAHAAASDSLPRCRVAGICSVRDPTLPDGCTVSQTSHGDIITSVNVNIGNVVDCVDVVGGSECL